mmetsp:Transcript_14840/g.37706  ORF Transcript_14840/g.37706 Transcript_14840/m.37706 type:complete len:248 (-) Transcript_14840:972-1715(-)
MVKVLPNLSLSLSIVDWSWLAAKILLIVSSGMEKKRVYRSLILPSGQTSLMPKPSGQVLGMSMQWPSPWARPNITPMHINVATSSSNILYVCDSGGGLTSANHCRSALKNAPMTPAKMAVSVRKGRFTRNCVWITLSLLKLGNVSKPMLADPLISARVKTAIDVQRKHRQVTFLDQKLEASSQENMMPPMGAPKAAARPAAAPAEMISLWAASFCIAICSQNFFVPETETVLSDLIRFFASLACLLL